MIDSPVRQLLLMTSAGLVLFVLAEINLLAIQMQACNTFCLILLDSFIVCTLASVYKDACHSNFFYGYEWSMYLCLYVRMKVRNDIFLNVCLSECHLLERADINWTVKYDETETSAADVRNVQRICHLFFRCAVFRILGSRRYPPSCPTTAPRHPLRT